MPAGEGMEADQEPGDGGSRVAKGSKIQQKSRLNKEIKSMVVDTKRKKWVQDTATRSNGQDKRRAWLEALNEHAINEPARGCGRCPACP